MLQYIQIKISGSVPQHCQTWSEAWSLKYVPIYPPTERTPLYNSWRLSRGLFIAMTQHCKRRMAPPTPHQLRRLRKVCAERSYSAIRRNLADFSYWYWGPFLCKGISRRENTQIAFVRFQEKTTHLRTYGPMVGIEGMKKYCLVKKVQAKKLVKSNKSKTFFVKLHFWQF